MAVVLQSRPGGKQPHGNSELPALENGDRLTAREFLRRFEAMPEIKKAELIEGIVYMGSPARITQHAHPDNIVQTWLGTYAAHTPGSQAAANATTRLDIDNVPQPDALLRLGPECGGKSRVDEDGYLVGPPELAVEICASSASIDLGDKLKAYRRAGIREYLIWQTVDKRFDWLVMENEDYQANPPDGQGIIRSRVFPGVWLDIAALLALDSAQVLDVLQQGLSSHEHKDFVIRLKAK